MPSGTWETTECPHRILAAHDNHIHESNLMPFTFEHSSTKKSDRLPRTGLSILAILLVIPLLGACGGSASSTTQLTYGLTLSPSGIDPHINASSELTIPLRSVYDTLVFEDPINGGFVPGLAESWNVSSDGLIYTFNLRSDVHFHDGTPFNAQAVKANIDYILNPDNHSQKAAFMLGAFQQVEVVSEYTVAFHLSEPFAPLMDSLSQVYLGMASPEALQQWGATEYQFHQVGTGPYRFVEYIPNDRITLERYADYAWGPSVYNSDQAQIDEIVFRFYEDEATRALALQSGEVDIIGEIPPHDALRLTESGDFNLYAVPIPGQPLQFLFNTDRSPTDDALARTALIQAVDRVGIVDTLFGTFSPVAEGPLCATTYGFSPDYPFPAYNPDAAAASLDDLGWIDDDGDGTRSRDGVDLELLLVVPPWGSNPEAGQLVAAAWEALGARVTIEVAPGFGLLKEAQTAGAYHAIGINFFGADPDLLRSFYASDGLYNWTGVRDDDLDQLLLLASIEWQDREAREEYYAEVAEFLRDEALILPLRDYVNIVLTNTDVSGLRFSAQGWSPFLIDLRLEP
jgi:peptide/nickel transport system substrate-binding protein